MVGLREIIQGQHDDEFLTNTDFDRGLAELTRRDIPYDLLIYEDQLRSAIAFIDRHPNQRFVLDHIAKPIIQRSEYSKRWDHGFRELAQRDNVVCKLSGMVTEVRDPDWSAELLRPYIETALDAFGTGRLMFGSDWPVCLLRAEYADWFEAVSSLNLSANERDALFSTACTRAYGLD